MSCMLYIYWAYVHVVCKQKEYKSQINELHLLPKLCYTPNTYALRLLIAADELLHPWQFCCNA